MEVMMKELGEIITGNTPSKKTEAFWSSEDICFIKPDIIADDGINEIVDSNEYISEDARKKARVVGKNSIFITCIGSIGKIGIASDGEYAFNQQINAIIPNNRVQPKYLAYNLLFNKPRLVAIANAPVVPIINKSQFGEFAVNIETDIDRQCEIVDVLDKLTQIIQQRNKEISALDELIKARFVEMFGTLHDNENGFEVVTIEDVCSLIKDGTHQTPQYTENKEEGFKFLSSKDVMSQKIDWTDIKYIPAELHEKLYATIKPQRNDILMSKNGVNYGVAAVNDTDEIFDIYVSLALLRPKEEIDPVFLRCVINNPETKRQFDSSIKGIGVPNLHLGEIRKTKIFLPPIELQKEFVLFAEQITKSKVAAQKALDETKLLFDSLMQQYFG
ncbi:restriction endonuclease subunit S [Ruminococcus hominis]|uniref:Restriction endonuclease subunit S n=1 Tax=Ruminococcus hominis TaxID=2763065 RepID=A0ABR7G6H9_9FIRM|nr:restriction endonuclease subunit S [Ruminococcus hominis]MBC5683040.1 restriction endonuclease subunit S [Ruminococcus hominis]